MRVENPVALSFIMQDEIYLLDKDKALYDTVETPSPVIETPSVSFNYLGGHKKSFLVMVHYTGQEHIEEKHLIALEAIFKRLDFSLDDVAILNMANYTDAPFERLMDYFKPQKLLLLGQNAIPAGMETLHLNITTRVDNCNALFSFSFDEMMDSTDNKKAFWEQMKQL